MKKINLAEHIVEIEGKKYIPFEIAVEASLQFDDKKLEQAIKALENIKIDLND